MPSEILVPDGDDIQQIDVSSVELFSPILNASFLSDQVEGVKRLLGSVESDTHQIVSIVTVQWYFNIPLGSGLRKVISNCLNQIKDPDFSDLVVEQIRVHARNSLQHPTDHVSDVVRTLLAIFDNFKLGIQAVLAESERVLGFLIETLNDQMEDLCEEDILALEKARLTEEVGETIRLLIHVVKVS